MSGTEASLASINPSRPGGHSVPHVARTGRVNRWVRPTRESESFHELSAEVGSEAPPRCVVRGRWARAVRLGVDGGEKAERPAESGGR